MQAIIIYDTNDDITREQVLEVGKQLAASYGRQFVIASVPKEKFSTTRVSDHAPNTADEALEYIVQRLHGKIRENRLGFISLVYKAAQDPIANKDLARAFLAITQNEPTYNASVKAGYEDTDRAILHSIHVYIGK